MLRWAAIFFIIAIVAAIFGFGGIAAGAASIAKILFFVFVVLFVLAIAFGSSIFRKWQVIEALRSSMLILVSVDDFLFEPIE